MLVERIEAQLTGEAALAYRRCSDAPLRSSAELGDSIDSYLSELESRSAETEFLDLETATRVADGCRALLSQLSDDAVPAFHRAVQACISYFVLEDDGEADSSVVGFDDDLKVVQVTAEVLGWQLPETRA